jgi:hypothetical protein
VQRFERATPDQFTGAQSCQLFESAIDGLEDAIRGADEHAVWRRSKRGSAHLRFGVLSVLHRASL